MFTANVPVFFTVFLLLAAVALLVSVLAGAIGVLCVSGGAFFVQQSQRIEGVVVRLALTKNGVQDMAWRRSPRPGCEHV